MHAISVKFKVCGLEYKSIALTDDRTYILLKKKRKDAIQLISCVKYITGKAIEFDESRQKNILR